MDYGLQNPSHDGALAAEALAMPPFESGRSRAMLVQALFAVAILLSIVGIVFNVSEFQLVSRLIEQAPVTEQELDVNNHRQYLLSIVMFVEWIVLVVAFLVWIHRAHRNLPSLRATELEFTPRWAVLWYFMPLANLFKPYQVMREIYNASKPEDAPEGGWEWRNYNAPALVKCWWLMFLLTGFFGNFARGIRASAEELLEFKIASATSAVHEFIFIMGALLALWLVRSVNRRQEERAAILAAAGM